MSLNCDDLTIAMGLLQDCHGIVEFGGGLFVRQMWARQHTYLYVEKYMQMN